MAEAAAKFPRTTIEIQRAVEEGDIAMQEPESSANENGLF